MPCKQAPAPAADEVAPLPRLLRAANTLTHLPDGGWRADNTDVHGIGMALQLADVRAVSRAAILGAGGTAAAAAVALAELGAEQIDVVVREPARAADLVRICGALGVSASVTRMAGAAMHADVVVSPVPIGAQPDLLGLGWRVAQTVLDVLYAPWPTPLAQR